MEFNTANERISVLQVVASDAREDTRFQAVYALSEHASVLLQYCSNVPAVLETLLVWFCQHVVWLMSFLFVSAR